MSSDQYENDNSDYGRYSVGEAVQVMDTLPVRAQTVVQELWYGDAHQNEYDLERHTRLSAEAITDAITILEDNGLVRSRPDMVSADNRVYWLNIEEDNA